MENRYGEGFDSWQDIAVNFTDYGYEEDRIAKAMTDIPEPEEVLFAVYGGASYEGDAVVSYRNGDKYYVVTGSHCSCYGLEGQWEPEEYDYETFIAMLDRKIAQLEPDSESPSCDVNTWKIIRQRAAHPRD